MNEWSQIWHGGVRCPWGHGARPCHVPLGSEFTVGEAKADVTLIHSSDGASIWKRFLQQGAGGWFRAGRGGFVWKHRFGVRCLWIVTSRIVAVEMRNEWSAGAVVVRCCGIDWTGIGNSRMIRLRSIHPPQGLLLLPMWISGEGIPRCFSAHADLGCPALPTLSSLVRYVLVRGVGSIFNLENMELDATDLLGFS